MRGAPDGRKKVIILGGGPNRIGQGIEFDYCCVHAAMALREEGIETIMVNCNPETVSTDYDTSDRLYFEPLTEEDVLNIVHREKPMGVVLQFGGQTPLKLAIPLRTPASRFSARVLTPSIGRKIVNASATLLNLLVSDKRRAAWLDRLTRRCQVPQKSAIPSWSGPPTCWADDPCRSSTMRPACSSIWDRP